MFASLRQRDFALLWTSQTISGCGNHAYLVAVPFQLLAFGASPIEVGLALSILAGATSLFVLVGGAVADRIPKRSLILANDLSGTLIAGSVAALGWSGRLEIWHLYAAAALLGATYAFLVPAVTSIVPEIAPSELLQSGIALRSASRHFVRVVGSLVGGAAVIVSGPPLAFAFDALTFLVSFVLFALTRRAPATLRPRGSLLGELGEGLHFVRSVPWLWAGLSVSALVLMLTTTATAVGLPLYVTQVLHSDASTYGVIVAACGAGAIAGGLVTARYRIRSLGLVFCVLQAAQGVALLGIGAAPNAVIIALIEFLAGIALSVAIVVWQSALQMRVRQELRGRVSSIDYFGTTLLIPLAPVASGALVSFAGPANAFLICGAVTLAVAASGLAVGPLRNLESGMPSLTPARHS